MKGRGDSRVVIQSGNRLEFLEKQICWQASFTTLGSHDIRVRDPRRGSAGGCRQGGGRRKGCTFSIQAERPAVKRKRRRRGRGLGLMHPATPPARAALINGMRGKRRPRYRQEARQRRSLREGRLPQHCVTPDRKGARGSLARMQRSSPLVPVARQESSRPLRQVN